MYGLPAYNEMDPTWFVALTYSFIFGAMFGDVGQGLLLFIGGFLLYKFKHITLAGIISCAGVFSTIFGFMFGSIFGFEDVIPALWLRPMNNMKMCIRDRFRYCPLPRACNTWSENTYKIHAKPL